MRAVGTRRHSSAPCSASRARSRRMPGRFLRCGATRMRRSPEPGARIGPRLPRVLLALRPGPAHGSRSRLERPRALSRSFDAEARDRGRADAGAPRRCRRPALGSRRLLWRMLVYSDDRSANELLEVIGGSTSGGSVRVNAMMRAFGLADSDMYGGYLIEDSLPPRRRSRWRSSAGRRSSGRRRPPGTSPPRARAPPGRRRPRGSDLALPRRLHAFRRALPAYLLAHARTRGGLNRSRRRRHGSAQGRLDVKRPARQRAALLAPGRARRRRAHLERARGRLRSATCWRRASLSRRCAPMKRLFPPCCTRTTCSGASGTGQTISLLGDQVTLIALPLSAVLVLDANAAQMGYLVAAELCRTSSSPCTRAPGSTAAGAGGRR